MPTGSRLHLGQRRFTAKQGISSSREAWLSRQSWKRSCETMEKALAAPDLPAAPNLKGGKLNGQ